MYTFNMSPFVRPLDDSENWGKLNLGDSSRFSGRFTGYGTQFSHSDWVPVIIIPLLAAVMLAATVFLLLIFRQNPTFVISTVAGCVIFITVYLVLSALDSSNKIAYE